MELGNSRTSKAIKLNPPQEVSSVIIERLRGRVPELELVPVEKSFSRVLAEDVFAPMDIPENNKAAMDGYAIRSQDVKNAQPSKPVRLRMVRKLFLTDSVAGLSVKEGEAILVPTGSKLPDGADAVLRVERARMLGEYIEVLNPVKPWENVEFAGEDVRKGSKVLERGKLITPSDLGMLIALGKTEVLVFKKPRVGILSVGGELKELRSPEPDKIVNNYAYVVAGLVAQFGGEPKLLGIAPDSLNEIKNVVASNLDHIDMLLSIGGCSVGEKDLVPEALKNLGEASLFVHGVKVAPLKVSGCGFVKGKPFVMLPGHIVSAFGTFFVFALPILNILCGLEPYSRPVHAMVELEEELSGKLNIGIFKLLKVRFENERLLAKPIPWGTNRLSYIIKANGYTILKPGVKLEKGAIIEAALLRLPEPIQPSPPEWLKSLNRPKPEGAS